MLLLVLDGESFKLKKFLSNANQFAYLLAYIKIHHTSSYSKLKCLMLLFSKTT